MEIEIERNTNLFQLTSSLLNKNMNDEIVMLGNIIKTDTIAMKKSFSIITNGNTTDPRVLEIKKMFDDEIDEYLASDRP
jgi:hypothetical protein